MVVIVQRISGFDIDAKRTCSYIESRSSSSSARKYSLEALFSNGDSHAEPKNMGNDNVVMPRLLLKPKMKY